ncbi:MAG: hypothetical protein J0M10_11655 [Chitinophagales bacterium]|nr:hypothetical protein [Chitinophagales bacterium]
MKTKFLFPLIIVVLFFSSAQGIMAQPPQGEGPVGPPPELAVQPDNEEKEICRLQLGWMKKKLRLSEEQVDAAEKAIIVYVRKRLALMKKETYKGNNDPAILQAGMERDNALKKMLTPKQFSRFDKNKHILENSFENPGGGIPPPPPM